MAIFTTAFVSVISAIAGGIIKGRWEERLAKQKQEGEYIEKIITSQDTEQWANSLKLLVQVGVIKDESIMVGINALSESPEKMSQFVEIGNNWASNDHAQFVAEHPELEDSSFALTGFKVRHGDVIDALTPIYAEMKIKPNSDLTLGDNRPGKQLGGAGGAETILEQEGYIITGVNTYHGTYFDVPHIIHIQIIWNKLTPQGIDSTDEIISEKLGNGNYARNISPEIQFRTNKGHYISDFTATPVLHTDGALYLSTIDDIKQTELPDKN